MPTRHDDLATGRTMARHYTTFVDLATVLLPDEAAVRARLAEVAAAEGEIAARLGAAPTVHG